MSTIFDEWLRHRHSNSIWLNRVAKWAKVHLSRHNRIIRLAIQSYTHFYKMCCCLKCKFFGLLASFCTQRSAQHHTQQRATASHILIHQYVICIHICLTREANSITLIHFGAVLCAALLISELSYIPGLWGREVRAVASFAQIIDYFAVKIKAFVASLSLYLSHVRDVSCWLVGAAFFSCLCAGSVCALHFFSVGPLHSFTMYICERTSFHSLCCLFSVQNIMK